jgi:hypothetical protein
MTTSTLPKSAAKRPQPRGGSRKGVPNKATCNAREAIALFVEQNVPRLQGWLDQIAVEQGPMAAVRCVQDMVEYHVPKLSRQENVGDGGGPMTVVIHKEQ